MPKFAEFDIKTGKAITSFDPDTGGQVQSYKNSPISYLGQWLKRRGLEDAPLYAAQFYEGVTPEDNDRLLAQGKHILFTGGTSGKHVYAYFTDAATAKQILEGNSLDSPIYDFGDKAAHYAVAYGSLPISDCYAETIVKGGTGAKILIIDDKKQSAGALPILDKEGKPVDDLGDLMSKMGDGTMLIPTSVMREVLLEKEVQTIIRRTIDKTDRDLTEELGVMGQWLDDVTGDEVEAELVALVAAEYRNTGRIGTYHVSADVARNISKMLDKAADEGIMQFRAAITDTPGMIKGTAKTSEWAEKLDVVAIVSLNNIKGAGLELSSPGIVELRKDSAFWIGRKEVATYGQQSVGMQVKITIPGATEKELNPLALARAEELARLAVDPYLLGQRYVDNANRSKGNPLISIDDNGQVIDSGKRADSIAEILAQDTYGELAQMPAIQRRLNEALRRDWLDAATSGVEVPSAIAQHHGKLEVWEIANKDLPHGAIVGYYRSPLPNVSAVALGVNNLKSIDSESANKRGAVYVNPWTAEHIAITDFDGDRLGQFVGYVAKDPDQFITQMHESVAGLESPAERYDAAHQTIEKFIDQGTELEMGKFPMTVQEFGIATAVENRPKQIQKAAKAPHPWLKEKGQEVSQAIFEAWTRVAENPIGKVANQGMNMQILAQNATNISQLDRPKLLAKIAKKFNKIDEVPSDDYLASAGIPVLNLGGRIAAISSINQRVLSLKGDDAQKFEIATQGLEQVSSLLKDYAEYPVASLLQTSVDYLKSSNGIDEQLYGFGQKLLYQNNTVREHMKSEWTYTIGQPPEGQATTALTANTQEPIGDHVNAVSAVFTGALQAQRDIQLGRDDPNSSIRRIVPLTHSQVDSKSVDRWVGKYIKAREQLFIASNRQQEAKMEDRQPTLVIKSSSNGRELSVQKLIRAQDELNTQDMSLIWNLADNQARNFLIKFTDQSIADNNEKLDPYAIYVTSAANKETLVGFTTPEMIQAAGIKGLDAELQENGQKSIIRGLPDLLPPRSMVNDIDRHKAVMNEVLSDFKAAIPAGREHRVLSALWYGNQSTDSRSRDSSTGMSIATKIASDQLVKYVGVNRSMDLGYVSDLGNALASRGVTADIRVDNVIAKEGKGAVPIASAILPDGAIHKIGGLLKNSIPPAPGTVFSAFIVKKLNPHIDLKVGEDRFRVTPASNQPEQTILSTKAAIQFKLNDSGEIGVIATSVPKKKGEVPEAISLGILDPRDISKYDKSGLQATEGIYSRTLHPKQIELHVQELVAHQPVAEILKQSPVALPDRQVSTDISEILDQRLTSELPTVEKSVPDTSTVLEVIDSPGYVPNRVDLVNWYKASLRVAEPETTNYLVQLGTQLKSAYAVEAIKQGDPPVDRLPDDYHSDLITITMEEKTKFDQIIAAASGLEVEKSKQVSRGGR